MIVTIYYNVLFINKIEVLNPHSNYQTINNESRKRTKNNRTRKNYQAKRFYN